MLTKAHGLRMIDSDTSATTERASSWLISLPMRASRNMAVIACLDWRQIRAARFTSSSKATGRSSHSNSASCEISDSWASITVSTCSREQDGSSCATSRPLAVSIHTSWMGACRILARSAGSSSLKRLRQNGCSIQLPQKLSRNMPSRSCRTLMRLIMNKGPATVHMDTSSCRHFLASVRIQVRRPPIPPP